MECFSQSHLQRVPVADGAPWVTQVVELCAEAVGQYRAVPVAVVCLQRPVRQRKCTIGRV